MPGGPPRFLVAKPGLDGHSNGAEQIAVAARDAGMEVIYSGHPADAGADRAAAAADEDPDVIGLSILSGSHLELVPEVLKGCRCGRRRPRGGRRHYSRGRSGPSLELGLASVYTPKDFELARIMRDIRDLADRASKTTGGASRLAGPGEERH